MSIEIQIRPATPMEGMYTYTQSSQIQGQTGCIGHLRADMDSNGGGFFSSWDNHRGYLKTDRFKEEFDQVINRLRFGTRDENGECHIDDFCFLKNRNQLSRYCRSHPSARMQTEEEYYGFRVDTENYTYMMRLNPNKGVYNLYCYCYMRDWLNLHLKNAEQGIRFIDSHYNTLFKVPDGGKVRVLSSDGKVQTVTCRYADDYHLEFGSENNNLFHICELAERLENNGLIVEPVDVMPKNKSEESPAWTPL